MSDLFTAPRAVLLSGYSSVAIARAMAFDSKFFVD
jgi:hypothetical protein